MSSKQRIEEISGMTWKEYIYFNTLAGKSVREIEAALEGEVSYTSIQRMVTELRLKKKIVKLVSVDSEAVLGGDRNIEGGK